MACEYFLDTERLFQHTDLIREEESITGEICSQLRTVLQQCSPVFEERIVSVLQKAYRLMEYYAMLGRIIQNSGMEAEQVIIQIAEMLEKQEYLLNRSGFTTEEIY